jgi:hypothetical protein
MIAQIQLDRFWVWTDWTSERIRQEIRAFSFTTVPLGFNSWPGKELPSSLLIDMPDPPAGLLAETVNVRRKLMFGCGDNRRDWADLTVNVAEGNALDLPESPVNSKLWQGARYAVLRPEFLSGRTKAHNYLGPVLIVIGGTDAARISLKLTEVLLKADGLLPREIHVVLDSHHPDRKRLEELSRQYSRLRLINPSPQIAIKIEQASCAIVAPGNLLFECIALNTPALALAQNARQEREFKGYPWLWRASEIELIPSRLRQLLDFELDMWSLYAKRTETGQSISRLASWCQRSVG